MSEGVRMPLTTEQALAVTKRLHATVVDRQDFVRVVEEYYRGQQALKYASAKWREFHGNRYAGFADNWCAPVANTPNERLRVDGFRLDDDPEQSDAEKGLWKDWQLNGMEAQSSQGFLHGLIARRSYVKVWGTSDDEPIATWERADQMTIEYDPARPGVGRYDLKTWVDGDIEYATMSTPDEVWKWKRPYKGPGQGGLVATDGKPLSSRGTWEAHQPADDDRWPIDNPMGVITGVEMPNRPLLGAEPLSEIEGTMAMQDAINLLWAFLFTQADFASMPARVVMGQEPPKLPILDATGQQIGERAVDLKKLAEDRILWLTGKDTKIGQWDAAKLDVFSSVIEIAVTHIAAQTSTPATRLVLGKGMVNVSADGMRAAETGQVMKVREMQLFLTPPVRGVFQRFALVRDQKDLAEKCRLGTVGWRDAENHSEAQRVDALQKLDAIGFPFAWIAERYGLSPSDVARVLEMKAKEREDDPLLEAARQLPAVPAVGGVPEAPVPTPPAE
jgi:hypothetical protein